MSMFWCNKCDNLSDADDGCEVDPNDPKGIELICQDCADNLPEKDDD